MSESFGLTGPYVCWAVLWNYMEHFLTLDASPLFLQTREEIIRQLVKLVGFMEYSRYFQEIYPSHANSETKKVWTLQPKPSHTRGAAWGAGWAAQERCSSAALPSDYITRPVALVQHCSSRGAAQRSSRCAAAPGRLSISLVCVLHNTITLTLTAVRTVKVDTFPQ